MRTGDASFRVTFPALEELLVKTPIGLESFGLVALILGLAASGISHAQLGKPTYTTPPPAPPAAPVVAPDVAKDKSPATGKRPRKDQEMGVSGGSICHVDPDLCPPSPAFPPRAKNVP